MTLGVVEGRSFGETGKKRGLRNIELGCGFAEITLRCHFDAPGAPTEIYGVQIEFKILDLSLLFSNRDAITISRILRS